MNVTSSPSPKLETASFVRGAREGHRSTVLRSADALACWCMTACWYHESVFVYIVSIDCFTCQKSETMAFHLSKNTGPVHLHCNPAYKIQNPCQNNMSGTFEVLRRDCIQHRATRGLLVQPGVPPTAAAVAGPWSPAAQQQQLLPCCRAP